MPSARAPVRTVLAEQHEEWLARACELDRVIFNRVAGAGPTER